MEFTSYQPGQPIEGTEPLEDGRYECVIVAAEDRFDNDGSAHLRVTFMPIKGGDVYAWPVLKITDTARGIRFGAALADALQIDRSNGLRLEPIHIRGQRVLVSTRRWDDDKGRTNVGVDAIRGTWTERGGAIPAAPQTRPAETEAVAGPPPAKWKPRTPAAAVATARGDEAGGSDDVPF
jgi:hypothetical protein